MEHPPTFPCPMLDRVRDKRSHFVQCVLGGRRVRLNQKCTNNLSLIVVNYNCYYYCRLPSLLVPQGDSGFWEASLGIGYGILMENECNSSWFSFDLLQYCQTTSLQQPGCSFPTINWSIHFTLYEIKPPYTAPCTEQPPLHNGQLILPQRGHLKEVQLFFCNNASPSFNWDPR